MEPLHVGLVPPLGNRSSSTAKDGKMVNCYPEAQSAESTVVIKRPGYTSGTLYEAGTAQGISTYLGTVCMVVNDKFFSDSTTSFAVTTAGKQVDFS